MHIKTLNIMPYNRCYTLSHASRLFVLGSIILLGLAMSSCASSDDPTSQGVGTEDISSNTNTGVALNHINANVLQASVQGFTRGAVPEDTASPDSMSDASDGGLTCDVAWGAPSTTRAADTGYNMQWANIGSSTSIAILPRGAAVGTYSYTVSTTGAISSSSPYYFQTASNDVITSWYPYNSGDLLSFTVQSDQSTLANYIASDLLYTSSKVTATSQNLTYSHKMAQIIVDVTVNNANYLTNSEVQSLTIAGLKTNCTVTNYTKSTNEVCTPTFTAGATTATISAYAHSKSSTSITSTATFIMCVPAQTISTSQVFTVTVGGTAYTGKLSNAQSLEWGSAYNISITFDGKATMVYPSGNAIAVGDYYGMAVNGQAVVVKNASISSASSKGVTLNSVVFSTTTSSTDKSHGWTHGYAISLKDASSGIWKTDAAALPALTVWGSSGKKYSDLKNNIEGYTETSVIKNTSGYSSSTYPLCYNTLNHSALTPKSSSGWYLPSMGQWHYVLYNLGDYTGVPINNTNTYWWFNLGTGLSKINGYFSKAEGTEFATDRNYGCSSLLTTTEPYCLSITSNDIGFDQDIPMNYYTNNYYSRPVLAF